MAHDTYRSLFSSLDQPLEQAELFLVPLPQLRGDEGDVFQDGEFVDDVRAKRDNTTDSRRAEDNFLHLGVRVLSGSCLAVGHGENNARRIPIASLSVILIFGRRPHLPTGVLDVVLGILENVEDDIPRVSDLHGTVLHGDCRLQVRV